MAAISGDTAEPRRPTVMISRGLCLYDFTVLPPAANPMHAVRAAILTLRSTAPFPDFSCYAVRVKGGLSVWSWSAGAVQQRIATAGAPPDKLLLIPESVWRVGGDGVRLIRGIDGYEAEVWSDARLTASQWWPAAPSEADWDVFMRSQGLEHGLPGEISEPIYASAPPPNVAEHRTLLERLGPIRVLILALLVIFAPHAYLLGAWIGYSSEMDTIEAVAQSPDVRAGLAARARAERAVDQLAAISRLGNYVDPIVLLDSIQPTLALNKVTIKSWTSKEDVCLFELQLAGGIELEGFVRQLTASPFLVDVTVSPGRNKDTISVKARIVSAK